MNLTKIDWLSFRTQSSPYRAQQALRELFGEKGSLLHMEVKKGGWNGFESAGKLSLDGLNVGMMAFGGQAMRGWVRTELSGTGCEWVEDWDNCESNLSGLDDFQIRRVDIALDTCKREVTHDKVVAAHRSGRFTTSGKPPGMTRIEPEDPTAGKTVYVGKRDQPKFLRAYEKGYEIASKFPGLKLLEIEGVPVADLYRLELELKAKHQPLPEDLINNRDQYFSGAYPYLQEVLNVEPEAFCMSRDKSPKRALASMLEIIRTQYGNTLFTALTAFGGDVGAVWEKIVGMEHNERLTDAGVLIVDHI